MKKGPMFGIVALLVLGLVAAGAFAMPFFGFGKRGIFGRNDAVKQAIEAGDYNAYMTAIEDSWNAYKANLTEEKFSEIVDRYSQVADKRAAMQAADEDIQEALENRDYNAWKEAVIASERYSRIADVITQDNFNTYVKLNQAIQDKDMETVKQLSEELGLNNNAHGRKEISIGNFRHWHYKGQPG